MTGIDIFRDRAHAGMRLGEACRGHVWQNPVVFGLARGGVAVGAEVAEALDADFEVLVVRKIGHPRQPEWALGAISESAAEVFDTAELQRLQIEPESLGALVGAERRELQRRLDVYRDGRQLEPLFDRDAIAVDDGIATGLTVCAAVQALRNLGARRVIVAAPVASPAAVESLRPIVDDLVCLKVPENFMAVGDWYENFDQLRDEDVLRYLGEF